AAAPKKPGPAITPIDLADLPVEAIARRIVALPIPAGEYRNLQVGKPGTLYFLRAAEAADPDSVGAPKAALARWTIEDKKSETLAENVAEFELSADGQKVLVGFAPACPPAAPGAPGPRPT